MKIQITPEELFLINHLEFRAATQPTAGVYFKVCTELLSNSEAFATSVQKSFPEFSAEGLPHAWKIQKNIQEILEPEVQKSLSDSEIFVLILSAVFHDLTLFWPAFYASPVKIKEIRLKEFGNFLNTFLSEKSSLDKESLRQIINSVQFIIKSLHQPWDEITATELFRKTLKVLNQPIRPGLLLCILRIVDYLDFSPDRTCHILAKKNPDFVEKTLRAKSSLFRQIQNSTFSPKEIMVEIKAQNKEDHIFWSDWFGHLKQDIFQANTSVFIGENKRFQLAVPNIQIQKAPDAAYDIWPLRFELDESGRIWKIISQAVYTSRFDFLREMIQNAIDADLFRIYDHDQARIPAISPRSWSLQNYAPQVVILFSEQLKFLEIKDNGTGMDENVLQYFLFKIAQTGYEQQEKKRDFLFPAIAKFGIGFISILLRAARVIINTKSIKQTIGRKITLQTDARNAYSEIEDCDPGTSIQMYLKDKYSAAEMVAYLLKFYRYTSVPIYFIDLDKVLHLVKMADGLTIPVPEILKCLDKFKSIPKAAPGFSEFQKAIQSTTEAVKGELKIEPETSEEANNQFEQIVLKIFHREISQNQLEAPLLLYLDNQFEILQVSPISELKSKQVSLGILFVPVTFISYDEGIEWQSLHGFVVHNNEIKRSIIRYSGIAEEFDDPDKTIFLSQEEMEDEEDYESDQIVIDTLDVMRKYRNQLGHKYEFGEPLHHDIYEEIFLISDQIMSRRDEFDGYPTPYLDKKGSRLHKESAARLDLYKPVFQLIEEFSNDLFQDGIKIPVNVWAVAPLGMCRGLCNLTGNARFDLNVTRNAINETPVLVSAWVTNYGHKIQTAILGSLSSVFKSLKCSYKIKELIVPRKNTEPDILYRYASDALINWKE